MSRVVVVLGASGTIGVGFVRVCLEAKGMKVVPVFRTAESMEKTLAKLGNPCDSNLVPVVGSIATEAAGEELRKQIEQKAGPVTDVVNTVGTWNLAKANILSQSLETLTKVVVPDKLAPHFVAAKTFIPVLRDRPGSTYTFISGACGKNVIMRGRGNISVAQGALKMLPAVIMDENRDKEIRINEFMIGPFLVVPWDSDMKDLPQVRSNLEMGKALLSVLLKPAARGLSMFVTPDNLEQITNTGVTEKVNEYVTIEMM